VPYTNYTEAVIMGMMHRITGVEIKTPDTPWHKDHLILDHKENEKVWIIKHIEPCLE